MIIKIPKILVKEVDAFTKKRSDDMGEFYRKARGAFKPEDIAIGAFGEIAAYKYLTMVGHRVEKPDFTMHKRKTFGADLFDKETNSHFHVKSQSRDSEERYGCSFLFQKSDALVKSPKENHYIVCCVVDLTSEEVEIVGEVRSTDAVFGECKVDWLRKTKIALYLRDQKKGGFNVLKSK